MFSLSIFLFHLANAAVLPLLGEAVGAKGASRFGIPFISAAMAIGKITALPTSWLTGRIKNYTDPKNLVLIGFLSLCPRCIAIWATSSYYDNNIYAMGATQLFDGIGAGIVDTSVLLYAQGLTVGTGRFGAVFGFIELAKAVGGAMSNLLGGYLAHISYALAFLVFGVLAVLPCFTFFFGVTTPESMISLKPKKQQNNNTNNNYILMEE